MPSLKTICFTLCALLLVSPALLTAQPSYPDNLNAIVKQYPGSTVMASAKNKQETNAMLNLTGPTINDVMKYYKSALGKTGWKIENEMEVATTKSVEFQKEEKNLVVGIVDMGGQLMITLALTQ